MKLSITFTLPESLNFIEFVGLINDLVSKFGITIEESKVLPS